MMDEFIGRFTNLFNKFSGNTTTRFNSRILPPETRTFTGMSSRLFGTASTRTLNEIINNFSGGTSIRFNSRMFSTEALKFTNLLNKFSGSAGKLIVN